MTTAENREQRLADAVDAVLRVQPLRGAPASLETKVLTEMARRAAQPWWARGYVAWPTAARVGFLLASVGFAKAALVVAMYLLEGLEAVPKVVDLAPEVAFLRSLASMGTAIAHSVPSLWWYAAVVVIVSAYVLLFLLGATGYRALYARR